MILNVGKWVLTQNHNRSRNEKKEEEGKGKDKLNKNETDPQRYRVPFLHIKKSVLFLPHKKYPDGSTKSVHIYIFSLCFFHVIVQYFHIFFLLLNETIRSITNSYACVFDCDGCSNFFSSLHSSAQLHCFFVSHWIRCSFFSLVFFYFIHRVDKSLQCWAFFNGFIIPTDVFCCCCCYVASPLFALHAKEEKPSPKFMFIE